MRAIIEFCSSNLHSGTELVMKRLEERPDLDVIEYGCLGNCGECYTFPYALVNGEIVAAANAEELEQQIENKIKQIDEMLDLLGE
ncbi:YuzB family protein [Paenibacillus sp. FSL H8-0034]|uniref:YuzB family protein n=1 Tax=Paenibacillus sp. FSL H8-0034 TaxID=2954671 RepID=UPI0030FCA284